MRKIAYILFALFAFASCNSDNTTLPTNAISEISIDGISDNYYLKKNESLDIKPRIAQTMPGKALTYQWEMDQKVISRDARLHWEAKLLGTYQCRLIVKNEDGSTFYPFTVHVNSPYEEGIAVLSMDEQGKSMLSFMLNQVKPAEKADAFYNYDCFAKNNEGIAMADSAVDMTQCNGSLVIACAGSTQTTPSVYYLNDKTFLMENQLTATNYPDFRPRQLLVPVVGAQGTDYPILCQNGKAYAFSAAERVLAQSDMLPSRYGTTAIIADNRTIINYSIVLWDEEAGDLCMIYSGYGPFFCSKTYHVYRKDLTAENNYFNGQSFHRIISIDRPIKGGSVPLNKNEAQCIVITKVTQGPITNFFRTILASDFWVYNYDTATNQLQDNGGKKPCGMMVCPITDQVPVIASSEHKFALFPKGNVLKRWYYLTSETPDKAKDYTTIGSASAVITAMAFSPDHKQIYVAYYEPTETGLNGHLSILDPNTGSVLYQYDNISYRPTKVIYKTK